MSNLVQTVRQPAQWAWVPLEEVRAKHADRCNDDQMIVVARTRGDGAPVIRVADMSAVFSFLPLFAEAMHGVGVAPTPWPTRWVLSIDNDQRPACQLEKLVLRRARRRA